MKIQQKLATGILRMKIILINIFSARKAAEEVLRIFSTPFYNSATGMETVSGAKAEKLSFDLNGKKIYGYRYNSSAEKKVLLLHGFSSASDNFQHFVHPLTNKNYAVLAFDAPAHGRSEGKTTTAIEYAEMIREIILLYGPIQGFIAHSFGGIALCLALESMSLDIGTRIILVAPATETVTAVNNAFKMLGVTHNGIRQNFDDLVLEKSGHELSWYSIRRCMHLIKVPVLWLHDENDDITPLSDVIKVKSDGHTHITYLFTKGLGHRKIYRDENVKEKIMAFL